MLATVQTTKPKRKRKASSVPRRRHKSAYRPSTIKPKRRRRAAAGIAEIKDAILDVLSDETERPMTVRQLFYQLVSLGAIAKTEGEYKNTVVRLLSDMRLDGAIPWSWISDNTRWVRQARTFNGLGELLNDTQALYRRDLWRDQPVYVEVWCEKDALAGVFSDATYKWGVPLMVSRGYASLSYLQSCAETIREQGKPCYLYQFGDHDPSGVSIVENIERRLRQFAPDAEIHFERVAVTPEQIEEWDLPTRPTKRTDTRARNFEGASTDVDSIRPSMLRQLCESAITQHVDPERLERTQGIEEHERETLSWYVETLKRHGLNDSIDDDDDDE